MQDMDRSAKHRRFILNLIPMGGHHILSHHTGYVNPGRDGIEREVKESMTHWLKVQHSGAIDIINDDAWWMGKFMDPHHRLSKSESDTRHNELMSFAVAVLGDLIDEGHVKWVNEPKIPVLVTSDSALIDDVSQAKLDRLEASLKEMNKDGK